MIGGAFRTEEEKNSVANLFLSNRYALLLSGTCPFVRRHQFHVNGQKLLLCFSFQGLSSFSFFPETVVVTHKVRWLQDPVEYSLYTGSAAGSSLFDVGTNKFQSDLNLYCGAFDLIQNCAVLRDFSFFLNAFRERNVYVRRERLLFVSIALLLVCL